MYDKPQFGWEPVARLLAEPNATDLMLEHYAALSVYKSKLKLNPNFQLMIDGEKLGRFKVWAARDDDLLVGYLALWFMPHIHYQDTTMAVEDAFLLSAPYRQGWTGIHMIEGLVEALREMGVGLLIIHEKVHFAAERGGLGKLYRRLGFEHSDNLWSKILN